MATTILPVDDRFMSSVVLMGDLPVTREEYFEVASRPGISPEVYIEMMVRAAKEYKGEILPHHQAMREYRGLPRVPRQ